ncbi:aspartate/glutamate racemase family protein [Hyphococcus sp. DH-69]|uniref:aspartate/glutamate racemase family protein n=1 Tax=Hyphococcus formosus TaxID=3143534 RepID=UPI00398BA957
MIVPVPVPKDALDAFASQIPAEIISSDTKIDFVCAAKGGATLDSIYEGVIADAFCLEAGARSEDEGYDAVCVNSMSDSGVAALRSRLSIPVVGTAQATYHLASQLGKKFSILSMWDRWQWLYEKVLQEQGLLDRLASIRSIGVRPDTAALLAGKEDSVFPELLRAAELAVEVDGADLLVLGSTTMHQSHTFLSENLSVPVLNPGLVGFATCTMLINLNAAHSKRSFIPPERVIDDIFATRMCGMRREEKI